MDSGIKKIIVQKHTEEKVIDNNAIETNKNDSSNYLINESIKVMETNSDSLFVITKTHLIYLTIFALWTASLVGLFVYMNYQNQLLAQQTAEKMDLLIREIATLKLAKANESASYSPEFYNFLFKIIVFTTAVTITIPALYYTGVYIKAAWAESILGKSVAFAEQLTSNSTNFLQYTGNSVYRWWNAIEIVGPNEIDNLEASNNTQIVEKVISLDFQHVESILRIIMDNGEITQVLIDLAYTGNFVPLSSVLTQFFASNPDLAWRLARQITNLITEDPPSRFPMSTDVSAPESNTSDSTPTFLRIALQAQAEIDDGV